MKEVVTIQVGNYANFVGSHFWNFQDELMGLADSPESSEVFRSHGLNMDVLYRTGETPQGILTYTPRLVSVDFQGSLGSMSAGGTLYGDSSSKTSSDILAWTGKVNFQASEPVKQNLFLQSLHSEDQKRTGQINDTGSHEAQTEIQEEDIVECLENGVGYWTDFSKVHYHPRSLYELNGLWTKNQDFDYGMGRLAFGSGPHREEVNDRLRFFIEECDHIQGIQFVADDFGGFSGVAAEFLENIADDFPNIPVLLYSLRSPVLQANSQSQKKTMFNSLHDAISFSRLSAFCNLIIPVGLPSLASLFPKVLCVDDEKLYHSSAVYASAMHSISLPFRMESVRASANTTGSCGAADMSEVIQMLSGQVRRNKVMILDVAIPAPALSGYQSLEQSLLEKLLSLTPETAGDGEDLQAVESMSVHGVLTAGNKEATVSEVEGAIHSAYENATTKPRFSHLSVSWTPLPIPLPFPRIFGSQIGRRGELLSGTFIGSSTPSKGPLDVHSLPMAARLRSSSAILPYLENRLSNLHKFGIQRGAVGSEVLRGWGFGKEELEEIGETISDMVTTLKPLSDEFSDSD